MNVCIKCDKSGGKLLNCHDNGCPVVVHEDCLGSEAKFDEMGNFCCPFCVYKRAVKEFSQAERKAVLAEKTLSKYLDGKRLGAEGFETVNVAGSSDGRNQCVELEKDCHEVTGPECSMRDKGVDVLLVNEESDVLLNRVGDSGGLNDDIDRVKVVEKQNELDCVVRRRGDECGDGKVDQQKDVDMKKRCQYEEKIQNDAVQTETVPEHHQDAGCFEAHKTMEENVDVEAVEEDEGRTDEVQNQEQAHKTTEKIVCKESAPLVHMEPNRKVDKSTASTCMDTNTILEKVTGAQPPCSNAPRRSSRKRKVVHIDKSSSPQVHMESAPQLQVEANKKVDDTTAATCMDRDTNLEKVSGSQPPCANTPRRSSRKTKSVHIEESSTPCKSSKLAKPPTIFTKLPIFKEKRKPLAWKIEEEEMLKKEVQKYSKSVKKNLPWQKILEEGRDAFDGTRTPADLKDKWKNILSKEPLSELS